MDRESLDREILPFLYMETPALKQRARTLARMNEKCGYASADGCGLYGGIQG